MNRQKITFVKKIGNEKKNHKYSSNRIDFKCEIGLYARLLATRGELQNKRFS
jgi:hypothetical protein